MQLCFIWYKAYSSLLPGTYDYTPNIRTLTGEFHMQFCATTKVQLKHSKYLHVRSKNIYTNILEVLNFYTLKCNIKQLTILSSSKQYFQKKKEMSACMWKRNTHRSIKLVWAWLCWLPVSSNVIFTVLTTEFFKWHGVFLATVSQPVWALITTHFLQTCVVHVWCDPYY